MLAQFHSGRGTMRVFEEGRVDWSSKGVPKVGDVGLNTLPAPRRVGGIREGTTHVCFTHRPSDPLLFVPRCRPALPLNGQNCPNCQNNRRLPSSLIVFASLSSSSLITPALINSASVFLGWSQICDGLDQLSQFSKFFLPLNSRWWFSIIKIKI